MTEEQFERLIRIETKIDGFLQIHTDHETRIRTLEKLLWRASGLAMAMGGAIGTIANQLLGG